MQFNTSNLREFSNAYATLTKQFVWGYPYVSNEPVALVVHETAGRVPEYAFRLWWKGHGACLPRDVQWECSSIYERASGPKLVSVDGLKFVISEEEFRRQRDKLEPVPECALFVWKDRAPITFDERLQYVVSHWRARAMRLVHMVDYDDDTETGEEHNSVLIGASAILRNCHLDMVEEDPFDVVDEVTAFDKVYAQLPSLKDAEYESRIVTTPAARAHALRAITLVRRYRSRVHSVRVSVWSSLYNSGWVGQFAGVSEAKRVFRAHYAQFATRLSVIQGRLEVAVAEYDDTNWWQTGAEKTVTAQSGAIGPLHTVLKVIAQSIGSVVSSVASFRKDNPEVCAVAFVILLCYIIHKVLYCFNTGVKATIFVAVATVVAGVMRKRGAGFMARDLVEDVRLFSETLSDEVEPQSAGTTIAAGLASFLIARRVPLYSRVINQKKFEDGITAILNGATSSAETAVNFLLRLFGKGEVTLFRTHNRMLRDWREAAQQFSHKVVMGKIDPTDVEQGAVYERLRDQGLTYMTQYKDPDSSRYVKAGMDVLLRASPFFPATGSCKGRMEPLCACFLGAPGVGKTFLARMVAQVFVSKISTQEELQAIGGDLARMIFQKDSGAYWEGYSGQTVCVLDDFLQAHPTPGPDSEVANFIRMVNQWPYPLNMATLDMKGKFYFKSRFILATSNITNLSGLSKVITSDEAVSRRMGHTFRVTLKSDYVTADGKLAAAAFSEERVKGRGLAAFDDVWEFVEVNILSGQDGSKYTVSQVMCRLLNDYKVRTRIERNNAGLIEAVVRAPLLGYDASEHEMCEYSDLVSEVSVTSQPVEPQGVFGGAIKTALAVYGGVKLAAGVAKSLAVRAGKSFASKCGRTLTLGAAALLLLPPLIAGALRLLKGALKTVLQPLGLWRKRVEPQGAAFSVNDEVVKRISRNCVHVYQDDKRVGGGLMITDRLLVVPVHYVVQGGTHAFKVCELGGGVLANTVDIVSDFRPKNKDLCVLKTNRQVPNCADIRRHFWSMGQKFQDSNAYMVSRETVARTRMDWKQCVRRYDVIDLRSLLVQHGYRTTKGDCGNAIVSTDKCARQRLLGIHVAGGDGGGFFVPITREELEAVTPQAHCGFEEIERVSPLYNAGDTAFVKTGYSGIFIEPAGGPAYLRPAKNADGDVVDPMLKAVEATCRDFSSIKLPKEYDDAVDVVIGEIFNTFGQADLTQLTYEQAIEGVSNDPYINGIARGKSMGYPLCRKYHNKRAAFGSDGPYVFNTAAAAEVRAEYDRLVEAYNNGKRGVAVFRDVLKDEIRPQRKLDAVDTRLISASPVQYTILARRIYGRFVAEFMRNRMKHGGLVGINPMSHEWAYVYNTLASMNRDCMAAAGDYKQFDKSQHPSILLSIMRHITRRLPEGEVSRDCALGVSEDMARSVHIGGDSYRSGIIYQTEGALPSGHPMTSVINSIYNMVVFRLCWALSGPGRNIWNFREHVTLYVYGDDNLFAPDDEHIDFGMSTMARFAPSIGMEYTSEAKDGAVYGLKPLGQCGFLKRSFAAEPGYTFAPLELGSIYDMFNWRRSTTSDIAHLDSVARAALMELSAHRFDLFEDGLVKIRRLCWQCDVPDPTLGVRSELAYLQQRSIYMDYVPIWSFED